MMLERALKMFNDELEKFEQEKDKVNNLKFPVDFTTVTPEYEGKEMTFEIKPKFKKKLEAAVYVKEDKSKNSLF